MNRVRRTDPPHGVAPMPKVVNKATNEGPPMTDEEREFLRAIDGYKRHWGRVYPTWLEVLAVVKHLGYRRADVDEAGNVLRPDAVAGAGAP
jgi:hypothetical protein